ncbi:dihydroxy-acid dehydratase [Streptomyces sp. Amel2xB2]|nr:dihydroxy-acid dehydratase [Streptomyces sp. Amel2xB2]
MQLVEEDLRPSRVLTREAFENAIRVNAALGGSTNAVVHLLALAGRVEVPLELAEFDRLTAEVPVLADMVPSGRFLMEDFYYAGGLPLVIRELGDLIHRGCVTVTGRTVGEETAGAECYDREVIRTVAEPFMQAGAGTAVLHGSLCPDGAVLKVSAADPRLLTHRGRALVFDTVEEYTAAADDPALPVDPSTVLVVRGAGPKGYPGFPEVGNVPVPKVLLEAGVEDLVRISDARMSGTGYGTCVLHVAPESAVGGPLALVRTGDTVELDVPGRRLDLCVDEAELAARADELAQQTASGDGAGGGEGGPGRGARRGWAKLYTEHVMQADRGADLDFLTGGSGSGVPRHSH